MADIHANLSAAAKVLRFVLQSAVLGVGAYLVVMEQASGGIMIASSIMMGRALAPVEVALANWKQLVAAREGINRLRAVLKVDRAARGAGGQPAAALSQPDGREPQRRRAWHAKNGRLAGILWPAGRNVDWRCSVPAPPENLRSRKQLSASGRPQRGRCASTVLRLIIGILTISDDTSVTCPRMSRLFDGTVATNIARFDETATSEAILEAAQVAGAHEMILRLPDGYDTRIGERGTSLSAGQRQRIGLARAVFGRPFLIVLDEPNANLDAEGENALVTAIETLRGKHSIVIVVSHRANALAALDMAMVIYDGRSIAFGPREEVFTRVARSAAHTAAAPKQGRPSHLVVVPAP